MPNYTIKEYRTMSFYEGVEPTTYEITWRNGHVERIMFHAEIDGQWTLQLSAFEDDIRTIRNCATEDVSLGGAA